VRILAPQPISPPSRTTLSIRAEISRESGARRFAAGQSVAAKKLFHSSVQLLHRHPILDLPAGGRRTRDCLRRRGKGLGCVPGENDCAARTSTGGQIAIQNQPLIAIVHFTTE